jgi:hypothetical protein
MTTRITLTIDSAIADRARKYARKKRTSIDKIIENQIKTLLNEEEIAPAVKELAGILKGVKVNNAKAEYSKNQLSRHK